MSQIAVIDTTATLNSSTGQHQQEMKAVAIWALSKRAGRKRSASTDLVAADTMAGTKQAARLLKTLTEPETVTGADLKKLGNTAAAYWRDVDAFRDWVYQRGGTLTDVQPQAVQQWQTELADRYADSTVARKVSAVSSFYAFASKPGAASEGRIRSGFANPASGDLINRVKPQSIETPALTKQETIDLLAAADASKHHPRDRALVLTLATAGIRVSELCNANVADVGYEAGSCVLKITAKGRKALTVALAAEVCELLDIDDDRPGPLFVNNQGGRLTRYQVERILARLQRAAGIKTKLTPHVLRATFITEALETGHELWAVADAVGHSDTRTTRGYQRRAKSGAAKAAMAAGLVARFTADEPTA